MMELENARWRVRGAETAAPDFHLREITARVSQQVSSMRRWPSTPAGNSAPGAD